VSGPGTLLLDGVEELPPDRQQSLLHLVDGDGLSAGVGADNAAVRPWRLISTSSVELDSEIRERRFRADLYYRLNGVCLRIPPLRERKEDIEPLAKFFAERFSHAFGRERRKRLSRASLKVLGNHQWPGNMRELQNVIQRMVLLNDEEKVLKDLPSACGAMGPSGSVPPQEGETLSLKKASRLAARRVEKELILKALTQTHWNRKQAAQELDISYKALLYKLRQLELDR
jgi:DNA-binding NtrC family response regulator